MRKLTGWLCWLAVNLPVLWQMSLADPWLPHAAGSVILVLFNLAFGVYLGNSFAAAYAAEVGRVNRYLSDQNESLVVCNDHLLKRLTPHEPHESPGRPRTLEGKRATSSGS